MSVIEETFGALPSPTAAFSEELSGLAGIYQDDVNLMVWQRNLDSETAQSVSAVLQTDRPLSLNQIVTP